MAGFNREELKSLTRTTAAALDSQQQDHEKVRPKGGGSSSFHKIEEGDNIFRLAPFHPNGGGSTYSEALTVSRLTVNKPKRGKDNKIIEGEYELGWKYVFNARVHGGFPYDLVEAYMDVAKRIAIPNFITSDEQFNQIYKYIGGDQTEFGIKPTDSWVVWAMKSLGKDDQGNHIWSEWKRLQLKTTMKNLMKERGAEINRPDPYTDLDEGIPVVIWKAPKLAKGEKRQASEWYKVRLDSTTRTEKGRVVTEYVTSPLSDAQIEEWLKLEPLHSLYVNSFKRSDLDLQIEGLKNLDEELAAKGFPIQVTQYDEFLDIAEKLYTLVPEGESHNNDDEEEQQQEETKSVIAPKPPVQSTPRPLVNRPKQEIKEEVEVKSQGGSDKVKELLAKINAKNRK